MRRAVLGFWLLILVSSVAFAAGATTHSVTGEVLLMPAKGETSQLALGQRVESGAMLKSSTGSAILRFDDGQLISIAPDTTLTITDYKFNPQKPEEGNFVATLFKGAMRAVTGLIGERNKQNVMIKTSVATMGIRGTDFQLYLDSRLYISVLDGAVSATNDAGSAIFDAKNQPLGVVPSAQTQPRPATQAEFPANASAPFRQMQMLPLSDQTKKPNPADPTCVDRR